MGLNNLFDTFVEATKSFGVENAIYLMGFVVLAFLLISGRLVVKIVVNGKSPL